MLVLVLVLALAKVIESTHYPDDDDDDVTSFSALDLVEIEYFVFILGQVCCVFVLKTNNQLCDTGPSEKNEAPSPERKRSRNVMYAEDN